MATSNGSIIEYVNISKVFDESKLLFDSWSSQLLFYAKFLKNNDFMVNKDKMTDISEDILNLYDNTITYLEESKAYLTQNHLTQALLLEWSVFFSDYERIAKHTFPQLSGLDSNLDKLNILLDAYQKLNRRLDSLDISKECAELVTVLPLLQSSYHFYADSFILGVNDFVKLKTNLISHLSAVIEFISEEIEIAKVTDNYTNVLPESYLSGHLTIKKLYEFDQAFNHAALASGGRPVLPERRQVEPHERLNHYHIETAKLINSIRNKEISPNELSNFDTFYNHEGISAIANGQLKNEHLTQSIKEQFSADKPLLMILSAIEPDDAYVFSLSQSKEGIVLQDSELRICHFDSLGKTCEFINELLNTLNNKVSFTICSHDDNPSPLQAFINAVSIRPMDINEYVNHCHQGLKLYQKTGHIECLKSIILLALAIPEYQHLGIGSSEIFDMTAFKSSLLIEASLGRLSPTELQLMMLIALKDLSLPFRQSVDGASCRREMDNRINYIKQCATFYIDNTKKGEFFDFTSFSLNHAIKNIEQYEDMPAEDYTANYMIQESLLALLPLFSNLNFDTMFQEFQNNLSALRRLNVAPEHAEKPVNMLTGFKLQQEKVVSLNEATTEIQQEPAYDVPKLSL